MLAHEVPGLRIIEALRSLRTSLSFKLSEKERSKVVLITSAISSQKMFISANLSYLFAATGKKVLLIEADIRLASIKKYISTDLQLAGLSNVLRGEVRLHEAIQKNVYPGLDFMPSGPTVRNPGDLLAGDSMADIVNTLALNTTSYNRLTTFGSRARCACTWTLR